MSRPTMIIVVIVLICISSGCNYRYQAYPGVHRPDSQIALIRTLDEVPRVQIERIDGADYHQALRIEALPGEHALDLLVCWSNGYQERVSLTFQAREGVEYGLRAIEHGPPPPPEDPWDLSGPAMEQVAMWTWPIWGPPTAWHNWTAPKPTSRPVDHSMQVWIMQGQTQVAHWECD